LHAIFGRARRQRVGDRRRPIGLCRKPQQRLIFFALGLLNGNGNIW
jgi:hypothetical protein